MKSLRFAASYLLHRLSAGDRHGLHSPYVYHLLDHVIYDFDAKKVYDEVENGLNYKFSSYFKTQTKQNRLIYRIVNYLKPNNVYVAGKPPAQTYAYLQKAAAQLLFYTELSNRQGNSEIGLLFIDHADDTLQIINHALPYLTDKSVIIINNLYEPTNRRAWKNLQATHQVTVTIDLFYIGLIFFHEGQAKEHFKLKF